MLLLLIILASFIVTVVSLMYTAIILIGKYFLDNRIVKFELKLIISLSCLVSFALLTFSLNLLHQNMEKPYLDGDGNKQYIGTLGDLIGGTLNPILGLFGIIVAGLAFYAQYQANKQVQEQFDKQETREYKINFETKFFELIKIHRENVSEQNYTIYDRGKMSTAIGRKVFRLMHRELEECIKEVLRYRKIYKDEFITPKYKSKLENIISKNNLKIKVEDLALIDISYTIFFFGLGKESQDYLLNSFTRKYDYLFFKRLIMFLQLKPKKECKKQFKSWELFINSSLNFIKPTMDQIYQNRGNKKFQFQFNNSNLVNNYDSYKYYGGHQHRLGHYFRHLFQSYKYLLMDGQISQSDKYFYGKTLRGQISTYEQSIFFINSLSSFGHKWELRPERDNKTGKQLKLISEFHIIKNLPGNKFIGILYSGCYPNVDYEFKRIRLERK